MKEKFMAGGIVMDNIIETIPIVFVQYNGTENGVIIQDTSACSDSLASMMANSVLVLGPFPTDFENSVAPVQDPSKYYTQQPR